MSRGRRSRLLRRLVRSALAAVVAAVVAAGLVAVGTPPARADDGTVVNTRLPTIGGVTEARNPLWVVPGRWSPEGVDLAYQWLVDGRPVPGATGPTYELRVADLGSPVTVRVTASHDGYAPLTVDTPAVGPVQRCSFVPRAAPDVRGRLEVGQTLRAGSGSWSPTPRDYTFQWLVDGEEVPGATDSSYLLAPDDLGRRVSLRVTVAADGCTGATAVSPPSGPVGAGRLQSRSAPRITGTPVVGEPLAADAGTWDVEPTEVAYQWLRAGTPIPGATGASYTPVGADAGKWLAVVVTVSAPGYAERQATSGAAFPVARARGANVAPPLLTGPARLGSTLTVSPGEWSFEPDEVAYQWYVGARRVGRTTSPQLALDDPALRGWRVSVRVTATAEGHTPVTVTSRPTKPVAKGRPVVETSFATRTATVGGARVPVDATVTAPAGVPLTGEVRVRVDGRLVATRQARDGRPVRLTMPPFRKAGRHRVVVRYAGSPALAKAMTETFVRAVPDRPGAVLGHEDTPVPGAVRR